MGADQGHAFSGSRERRTGTLLGRGPLQAASLLLLGEFLVRSLHIRPSILPSPSRLLLEIWRQAPELLHHASATATASLAGMVLALAAGFVYAAMTVFSNRADEISGPVISVLQRIPWIVLAPLLVVWLGFGKPPAAAVAFLMCFFPCAVLLKAGLHSMPVETLEIADSMGADRAAIFRKIRLPACIPYITIALKLSVSVSFAGAAAAEFVGSDAGIGYLMQYSGARADTTGVLAALSLLVFMVLLLHSGILLGERLCIHWPADIRLSASSHTPDRSCPADSGRESTCQP